MLLGFLKKRGASIDASHTFLIKYVQVYDVEISLWHVFKVIVCLKNLFI